MKRKFVEPNSPPSWAPAILTFGIRAGLLFKGLNRLKSDPWLELGCMWFLTSFDFHHNHLKKSLISGFWKLEWQISWKAFVYDIWNVFINIFHFKPVKDWTEEKKLISLNAWAVKTSVCTLSEWDFILIKLYSGAKRHLEYSWLYFCL